MNIPQKHENTEYIRAFTEYYCSRLLRLIYSDNLQPDKYFECTLFNQNIAVREYFMDYYIK